MENSKLSHDEEVKATAEAIKKEMGLDAIVGSLKDEIASLKASQSPVTKVFVAKDVQKGVDELTAEERVKAFATAICTANEASLKALSEGVSADGGYTVPQDFYNVLLENLTMENVLRAEFTAVPMTRNVLTMTMIDNGPDAYWTGEGVTKTTTTADFTQPTITAYKLAAIIYLTDELIDDSAFDLTNVLIKRFATRIAEREELAFLVGNGTTQPQGLFTNSSVGTRVCSGNLDFDDIINLIYDLEPQYRRNAKFVVNTANVRELRLLKDTTNRYLWQDAVAPGQPATIHGYPVIEHPQAPEAQILFGDMREAYFFGDRQRMTVKITQDDTVSFTQDKTAIRVVERIAGAVIKPRALRKLTTIP